MGPLEHVGVEYILLEVELQNSTDPTRLRRHLNSKGQISKRRRDPVVLAQLDTRREPHRLQAGIHYGISRGGFTVISQIPNPSENT